MGRHRDSWGETQRGGRLRYTNTCGRVCELYSEVYSVIQKFGSEILKDRVIFREERLRDIETQLGGIDRDRLGGETQI